MILYCERYAIMQLTYADYLEVGMERNLQAEECEFPLSKVEWAKAREYIKSHYSN